MATPTFSPGTGTYTSAQTVTISDATADASIYFTTDGTTPTASSTQYSTPIIVSTSETLKAIATVARDTSSSVASATYTINGPDVVTVITNANGNITSIPPANSIANATFAYNNANRLASVIGSPMTATFVYDWQGQRYSKTDGGVPPTVYSYAQGGTLIAENDNGSVTDYIYVDGRPIATLQPSAAPAANQVDYVLADRLGTPQLASNSSGATVWSTAYQPFGTTGMVTASITQNLRFPGQYADTETGFSYNLNRDYMPNLGRYLETDRIGLAGGLNTYTYVGGNPMVGTDPKGEFWPAVIITAIVYYLTNPREANAPGPNTPLVPEPYDASNIASEVAGSAPLPFGSNLALKLGGGKIMCAFANKAQGYIAGKIAGGITTGLINSLFGAASNAPFYGSDPVDPSDPYEIPIGGGLYYYDEESALGGQPNY